MREMIQWMLPTLGYGLIPALLLSRILQVRGQLRRYWWVAALTGLLAFVPYDGIPLAGFLRGTVGDLSMTTLLVLLLGLRAAWQGRDPLTPGERFALYITLLVGGCALYLFTLGHLLPIDLYSLGYGPAIFPLALLAVTALGWGMFRARLLLIVPLAILAWKMRLFESSNLWDYLYDPCLLFYALIGLVSILKKQYRGRRNCTSVLSRDNKQESVCVK